MTDKDIKIEWYSGTGPGGQHQNKTKNACRVTHIPTGITASQEGRSRVSNERKAMKQLRARILQAKEDKRAAGKKARRDDAIKPQRAIRTYDFSRGIVTDHRSGKTASIKDILGKGMIDKLK